MKMSYRGFKLETVNNGEHVDIIAETSKNMRLCMVTQSVPIINMRKVSSEFPKKKLLRFVDSIADYQKHRAPTNLERWLDSLEPHVMHCIVLISAKGKIRRLNFETRMHIGSVLCVLRDMCPHGQWYNFLRFVNISTDRAKDWMKGCKEFVWSGHPSLKKEPDYVRGFVRFSNSVLYDMSGCHPSKTGVK